jgi:kinetochore protein Fta7
LTTVTNSADLFKAEVAREEKALAREKALLEDMERNAKMAEGTRRKQVKNVRQDSTSLFSCFLERIFD